MPIKPPTGGCPELRERLIPGKPGSDGLRVCGRPIYMNGVCDQCYRCKESLRKGGYNPMQATGGVSEQMNAGAFRRLHIEDDTLREKGIEHDVEMAMHNIDAELRELLGD